MGKGELGKSMGQAAMATLVEAPDGDISGTLPTVTLYLQT